MDGSHDEAALHGYAAAHATVAALELLADDAVGRVAEAGATVAVQSRAEQPQLGESRHDLARKSFRCETFGHDRRDLAVDESADGIADQPLVFAEQRCDVVEIERIRLRHGKKGSATTRRRIPSIDNRPRRNPPPSTR